MTKEQSALLLSTARLLREFLREKPIQYADEVAELNRVLAPFDSAAEEPTHGDA